MPMSKIELVIKWENNQSFGMESTRDDGETQTIIQMDENTHLCALWHDVTKICTSYMEKVLKGIGKEMEQ